MQQTPLVHFNLVSLILISNTTEKKKKKKKEKKKKKRKVTWKQKKVYWKKFPIWKWREILGESANEQHELADRKACAVCAINQSE